MTLQEICLTGQAFNGIVCICPFDPGDDQPVFSSRAEAKAIMFGLNNHSGGYLKSDDYPGIGRWTSASCGVLIQVLNERENQ